MKGNNDNEEFKSQEIIRGDNDEDRSDESFMRIDSNNNTESKNDDNDTGLTAGFESAIDSGSSNELFSFSYMSLIKLSFLFKPHAVFLIGSVVSLIASTKRKSCDFQQVILQASTELSLTLLIVCVKWTCWRF